MKTGCLPLIPKNGGLPMKGLRFITYSYSVDNLYTLFRQREKNT